MTIQVSDISFVVQGAVAPQITKNCLATVRNIFPSAELILSTYEAQGIDKTLYDKLIINQDPGFFYENSKEGAKQNNINRQLTTTLSGLKAASRKYAFKLRTDFILSGNSFLEFFDKFPKSESDYKIFQHKILSCSFFARNPREKILPYSYHPSDFAFFGLTTDLLNLFDIPLMRKDEEAYWRYSKTLYNRYVPEQYLWVNCLRKNGKKITFDYQRDTNEKTAEDTERYFASNFIFLSWKQFNLTPPARFNHPARNNYENCITPVEWLKLYKKYINNDQALPSKDKVRSYIKQRKKQEKILKYAARLCALPFIGRSRRERRHRIRNRIMEFLSYKFPA